MKSGRDPRPQWFDDLSPFARSAHRVSGQYPLRPAEADLVEIQVGMVRADVMEDAGNGTAHAVVEPEFDSWDAH